MDGLGMRSPEVQSNLFTPNNFESQSRIDYAKLRPQRRSGFGVVNKKTFPPPTRSFGGRTERPIPRSRSAAYPFFDQQHGPNTNVVLRARDAPKLAQAKREVEEMLERVRRAQSHS
jgi:hypothetical protein